MDITSKKRGLLSIGYPEKTKTNRINSAPDVVLTPPKNINETTKSTNKTLEKMKNASTSVRITRRTNIILKAIGSLGYGETIDEIMLLMINTFKNSLGRENEKKLDYLVDSFESFEIIIYKKKK